MTCEEARLVLAEEFAGVRSGSVELRDHMAACAACRAEASEVRSTWSRMSELPEPEPRPWLASRFYSSLDAYHEGQRSTKSSALAGWWPTRPVWQLAVSLALSLGCLALGLVAGSMLVTRPERVPALSEIAELRKEMTGMRQLVTLSLLQQQSASERLRGVTYSYRAEPDDVEVLSALLQTITADDNVDVRLAAVDALRNFGDSTVARRGLMNSLLKQNSPLVQISIIDTLVQLRVKSAVPALRTLSEDRNLDANVQKRVTEALQSFE